MSLETFTQMLTYKRPAGSKTERAFIRKYLDPLECEVDAYGNRYKRIGTAPILWSSHTDTVHRQGGKQTIEVGQDGWLSALDSDCLGADCTSGVYLMREMILRGIEGLYVFHRAEEVGGQGSSFIAKDNPRLLSGIQFAIAFDRKDFTSVITHQFGGRCCSDAFADSFSQQIDASWSKDDTGSFTDTANYMDLIGECTNISVGYFDQHTKREKQHWPFLAWLLEKLCVLDVSKLVSRRLPGEVDPDDYSFAWYYKDEPNIYQGKRGETVGTPQGWNTWEDEFSPRTAKERAYARLLEAIADHPDVVAKVLTEYGITADDILQETYGGSGYGRKGTLAA